MTYPWGVSGGAPGMRSTKRIDRADGTSEWLPAKCDGIAVKKGDILYFNTWGGGGWGDPLERDPALVLDDVKRDLVSVGGAKRYGVVIEDNAVNAQATSALRQTIASARGDVSLFDFGGSIEDIKARCFEETHIQPPQTPTFLK